MTRIGYKTTQRAELSLSNASASVFVAKNHRLGYEQTYANYAAGFSSLRNLLAPPSL
jgi:hypothetical protein